jgi:hypothetical protein
MDRIPSWLKPHEKHSAHYFKKDETGREIYFPWGDAGDAYYLRAGDKAVLKMLYFTSLLIASLFGGILVCAVPAFFIAPAVVFCSIVIAPAWMVFHYFYKGVMEAIKPEQISYSRKNPRIIRELFEISILDLLQK